MGCFPDEGTFEWTDAFLEKNPQYVELSDRKILEWARASGLGHSGKNVPGSNDKPSFNFGVRRVHGMSIRKVINTVAPIVPRNYLIMEVKSNLVAAERQELLKRFNYPCYKKTAKVMMGEPNKEYKSLVQTKLLKDKQAKSDNAWKAKTAEVARKKAAAIKQKVLNKQIADLKKKKEGEAAAKKKAAEEKKAAAEKKAAEEKKAERRKTRSRRRKKVRRT